MSWTDQKDGATTTLSNNPHLGLGVQQDATIFCLGRAVTRPLR